MDKLGLVLQDGGTVLLIGMGVVFTFLVILVFSMHIMGAVVGWLNKVFPEAKPVEAQKSAVKVSANDEIAVVLAAVRARNY